MRDVIKMAGGFTRNADQNQVRLLKADGRILDTWVESKDVEPGDAGARAPALPGEHHLAGQPHGPDTARPNLERHPEIKQPNALQVGSALCDLAPGLSFCLGYASTLMNAGVPLVFLAAQLRHTNTKMVEKVYEHLCPDAKANAIRCLVPALGISEPAKLISLKIETTSS
ncbi:MAG: hypothetical protein IPN59_09185 [Holophaga sp.]|nr:hypothetical protein [Holophaga sp.]